MFQIAVIPARTLLALLGVCAIIGFSQLAHADALGSCSAGAPVRRVKRRPFVRDEFDESIGEDVKEFPYSHECRELVVDYNDLKSSFKRQGYIICEDLVPPEHNAAIMQDMDDLMAELGEHVLLQV